MAVQPSATSAQTAVCKTYDKVNRFERMLSLLYWLWFDKALNTVMKNRAHKNPWMVSGQFCPTIRTANSPNNAIF